MNTDTIFMLGMLAGFLLCGIAVTATIVIMYWRIDRNMRPAERWYLSEKRRIEGAGATRDELVDAYDRFLRLRQMDAS